jgi:hypothetical protein
MKCSVHNSKRLEEDATFFKAVFDTTPCPNKAAYHGPDGRPLCESCAFDRKKAHEDGETILAIYQREKLGRIEEYRLRPIDMTPEQATRWLREHGVNVERFLSCLHAVLQTVLQTTNRALYEKAHARMRDAFRRLHVQERDVLRMRFAEEPTVLDVLDDILDEIDAEPFVKQPDDQETDR